MVEGQPIDAVAEMAWVTLSNEAGEAARVVTCGPKYLMKSTVRHHDCNLAEDEQRRKETPGFAQFALDGTGHVSVVGNNSATFPRSTQIRCHRLA